MDQSIDYILPPCPDVVRAKDMNKTITRFEEFVIVSHSRNTPVVLNLDLSHLSRMGRRMLESMGIESVRPQHIYGSFRFFQLADRVTFTDGCTTVVWKHNSKRMVSNLVY